MIRLVLLLVRMVQLTRNFSVSPTASWIFQPNPPPTPILLLGIGSLFIAISSTITLLGEDSARQSMIDELKILLHGNLIDPDNMDNPETSPEYSLSSLFLLLDIVSYMWIYVSIMALLLVPPISITMWTNSNNPFAYRKKQHNNWIKTLPWTCLLLWIVDLLWWISSLLLLLVKVTLS